jgi:hypothetical protein
VYISLSSHWNIARFINPGSWVNFR